jgi:type IV secretory pathway VirJ component
MRAVVLIALTGAAACIVCACPPHAAASGRSDPAAADTSLADLPLVEVPARTDAGGPALVIWLTGDGGWDETDKGASAEIASHGVPVVGFDCLHYFKRRHEPDVAASDLARLLRHYFAAWRKQQVVLVGYSLGGSVLPFMVNRLPADLKPSVRALVLLGPARKVDFEFHLNNSWFGSFSHRGDQPVLPELERLRGTPILCFYGKSDGDCICAELPPGLTRTVEMHGGHRVGTRYQAVTDSVLSYAR